MRLESVKKQRTSRCRFIPKSRTTSLWLTKRDKNKKKGEKREATARKTLIQLQLKKFRAELFALSLLSSNSCWFVSGLLCSLSPGLSFSLSLSSGLARRRRTGGGRLQESTGDTKCHPPSTDSLIQSIKEMKPHPPLIHSLKGREEKRMRIKRLHLRTAGDDDDDQVLILVLQFLVLTPVLLNLPLV